MASNEKKMFGVNRPDTNLRRNVFDLSESTKHSISAGMLLPTFVKELNPGEKVQLNVSTVVRSMPMNVAAFVGNRMYHHYFFVPFQQLWNGFREMVTGVQNPKSSLVTFGTSYAAVPDVDLSDQIYGLIAEGYFTDNFDRSSNTLPLTAEHISRFTEYRGRGRSGYGTPSKEKLNKVDKALEALVLKGVVQDENTITRLDLGVIDYYEPYMGVGDNMGDIQINEDTWIKISDKAYLLPPGTIVNPDLYYFDRPNKDRFIVPTGELIELGSAYFIKKFGTNTTTLSANPYYSPDAGKAKTLDEHGYPLIDGMSRLMDMLEYGFHVVKPDQGNPAKSIPIGATLRDLFHYLSDGVTDIKKVLQSDVNSNKVNIFRALAYQKIYNDFYKDNNYESVNAAYFNIDDFRSMTNIRIESSRFKEIFRLRYRNQPKDYFTGVVPSELFGRFDMNSIKGLGVSGISNDDNNVYLNKEVPITAKSIRAAFALDKMMKLSRRAGSFDYSDQIDAHYGFEPRGIEDGRVQFIGGKALNINVQAVITTADSEKIDAGRTAGYGFGSYNDNDELHFTAPEHGLIMCITSVVPETSYSCEGMSPFNVKFSRGDYFQPELQDLGLQPVFGYELRNTLVKDLSMSNSERNAVLGFVPRYAEYKTSFDKLHGEFRANRSLSAWAASNNFRHNANGAVLSTLKIDPAVLDDMFGVYYDGTEESDQFICSSYYECKVIRPMSITGQVL